MDIINLKYHDLKHIVGMLKEGEGLPAEELKDLEDSIESYGAMLRTGNEALDVVLSEKSLKCQRYGISLSCIADGEAISFLSKTDIYVLFGNILDNAIEAVMKVEDPEKRMISLSVSKDTGVIRIREKNSRSPETLQLVDGLPVTTKEDKAFHGFGTKSIRAIAEKHEGVMHVSLLDEYYTLNIAIPRG